MAGRQDLGEDVLDYLGSDQAKEFFAKGKNGLARTRSQIYKDYVKWCNKEKKSELPSNIFNRAN